LVHPLGEKGGKKGTGKKGTGKKGTGYFFASLRGRPRGWSVNSGPSRRAAGRPPLPVNRIKYCVPRTHQNSNIDYTTQDGSIAFDRNVKDDDIDDFVDQDWNFKGSHGNAFWNIHLISAHQGRMDYDQEPESEGAHLGVSKMCKSIIFKEVIRDAGNADERVVAIHEVGFALGAAIIEGDWEISKGVMYKDYQEINTWYGDQSLKEIRETEHAD